jgi:predicted aconitase
MRSFICAACGILAVLLILLLAPTNQLIAHGIALPASTDQRAAVSPTDVTLYHEEPFEDFKVVGQVRGEISIGSLEQDTQQQLTNDMKALAASMGANGIIVQLFVPDTGVQHAYTFIGTAIHVSTTSVGAN